MSCARIEWSTSTTVASGLTVRIAPFIAPMYSPAPKSVVKVTIAVSRFDLPAEPTQAFLDPGEFLLAALDLGVRLRRPGLAVLEFRLPGLEAGLCRLRGDALGRQGIPFRGEFPEAFLHPGTLGGNRLLPSFSIGLGAGHALLGVRFAVFHFVDPMLKALFPLPERGLLRLDLPLAGLGQRLSTLDFLLRPGLPTRDCVRPLLELLRLLCVRGLRFLERHLARLDVLQVRQERGLLFLQGGLQRLV